MLIYISYSVLYNGYMLYLYTSQLYTILKYISSFLIGLLSSGSNIQLPIQYLHLDL